MNASLFSVKEVEKVFADGIRALSEVNLEVSEGSFSSLLGPSGCGKSTLLQVLAGLLAPTRGAVTYKGRRVVEPPADVIYLFQQYSRSLFPWLTVMGNVAFGIKHRQKFGRAEVERRCLDYIRMVGLQGRESSYPWQLSGGMQQRVAIARALVCEPRALLMDEPFGSLDALTRGELQDFLLKLWNDLELTVVFVTHDVEEAVYLSQRVVVMSQAPGRIVAESPVDLSYPRNQLSTRETPQYLRIRRYLHDIIHG